MAAIFKPTANLALKLVFAGVAALALVVVLGPWLLPQADYFTGVGMPRAQPVPFSHEHHVSGLGLDCRYCHTSVETSSNAGLPPTYTCMTCHSQIWTNAAMLAPVRESLAEGKPLHWKAVNVLPDYVFFDHSIHVAKGVGCTTCHGPIGRMPLTWKGATLQMSWCLSCHQDPAPNLRPHADVFDPDWKPDGTTPSGEQLMARYGIHSASLTDCSVCHR